MLEIVSQESLIKVVMPEHILNRIKFLCKNIPKDEWSGVLFYTIKGSIRNPSKMVITLKDILPLDKGTKAFTSYDLDERFTDYLMESPKRMDYHIGHIHSHNDMNVYFSGTDMSELNDNSDSHNFYFSLIVNNWMEFTAKVATQATAKKENFIVPYKALDENGEEYVVEEKPFFVDRTVLMVYNCEIDSPEDTIKVPKSFGSKVEDLVFKEEREKAKKEEEKNKEEARKKLEELKKIPTAKYLNGKPQETESEEIGGYLVAAELFAKTYCTELFDNCTDIELFSMALINFTNDPHEGDTLEYLIEMLDEYEMSSSEVAKAILEVYTPLYAKFFPDRSEEEFVDDTEEVIEMFEEQVTIYPILNQTINGLKSLVSNFKAYANTDTIK